MTFHILGAAEMQERIAEKGRRDTAISREEFVDAITTWTQARRAAEEVKDVPDVLSRDDIKAMTGFDRLDVLRKGLLLNLSEYYAVNLRADVAPGVLAVITILSDNDRGMCTFGQMAIAKLLCRSRTAIADAVGRLKAAKLVDSTNGRADAYPVLPRLVAAHYNHTIWLAEALKPVPSKGQVQTCPVQGTGKGNLSRTADRLGEPVPSKGQVDGDQPVPSKGHEFTKKQEQKQSAPVRTREELEITAVKPPARILPPPAEGEPEISGDQARRWIRAARGWGYPVGQEAHTFPDNDTVALALKGIVMVWGRKYTVDVVSDALEAALIDVETTRAKGKTADSKTGINSIKYFFEQSFRSKLRTAHNDKLTLEEDKRSIAAKADAEREADKKIQERRVAAFDGAVERNSKEKRSLMSPKDLDDALRIIDRM